MSRSSTQQLTDQDLMPWGQYKNSKMQEIPVDYLHWLWTTGGLSRKRRFCPVAGYINNNLDALQMENADLIWN